MSEGWVFIILASGHVFGYIAAFIVSKYVIKETEK